MAAIDTRILKETSAPRTAGESPIIEAKDLFLYYGKSPAIKHISMGIKANSITAIIGPSGCGKSTFLRCLNRMNDLVPNARVTGSLIFKGRNIYDRDVDVVALRKEIGMVFQKPNPFPMSIYDNVAYGPRIHGVKNNQELDRIVERSLKNAALWDELKDRLRDSALSISGGQQQRLCIARCLAVGPDVLLMDEPCSALDPIATAKIEDLMRTLKEKYTIIIVTHNMQQAARVSDRTAFFLMGDLIEYDATKKLFETPSDRRTEDYITGRFG
jgi:phosphate transport system ATP-binding protein